LRALAIGLVAIAGAMLLTWSGRAESQELEHAMRQPWTLYVFVSTGMPHQTLVDLAREAGQAHAAVVFRGFPGGQFDLQGEQRFVAQLNAECCDVHPAVGGVSAMRAAAVPAWSIDPALYRRFGVDVVPCFVLAATGASGDQSYSKVSGDMALANALKYFAQKSAIAPVRQQAVAIYQSTYGGRQ
jgi:conjugal transfer pilus assembly protein TrbC